LEVRQRRHKSACYSHSQAMIRIKKKSWFVKYIDISRNDQAGFSATPHALPDRKQSSGDTIQFYTSRFGLPDFPVENRTAPLISF
jgi:hypothetical protein